MKKEKTKVKVKEKTKVKPKEKVRVKPKEKAKEKTKEKAKPAPKAKAKEKVAEKPKPKAKVKKKVAEKPAPKAKAKEKVAEKPKPKAKAAEKETSEKKEKTRYSDKELEEFREIILLKIEEANNDLVLLKEAYSNLGGADINDTSPTFKVLEEGSQVLSKEENSQLAMRQMKFIRDLENALIRIENKTYGICRITGKLIAKDRLRSVPHATLSMEAKLLQPRKR